MDQFFRQLDFSLPYNSFYSPYYNYSYPPLIGDESIYTFLYPGLILLAAFIFFLLRRGLAFSLLTACWILWGGVVVMQTLHQHWYVTTAQNNIGHLIADRKNEIFFDRTFQAARLFSSMIKPGATAKIVGAPVNPHMDMYILPYFLYPQVDAIHRHARPQYMIFFHYEDTSAPELKDFRYVASVGRDISLWQRSMP